LRPDDIDIRAHVIQGDEQFARRVAPVMVGDQRATDDDLRPRVVLAYPLHDLDDRKVEAVEGGRDRHAERALLQAPPQLVLLRKKG
jgi:hypothetical protein